jgi:thioredoxin-related protein
LPSEIERVQRQYKDRLTIVAVNIQESRDAVAKWAKDKNVSFMILLDTSGAVTREYEVTATPTVFVLSRDGKLVGKALGTKNWTSEQGQALIGRLVGS